MIGLSSAVRQLTRLPIPSDWTRPDDRAGRSFAFVGAGLGAAGGLVAWACFDPLGPLLAVIPGIAVVILVSGARPEDGLARVAEGGTLGTAAVSLSIGYRVVAAASVPPHRWIAAFLLVHAMSRASMLVPHLLTDPRKERIDVVSWLINAAVVFVAVVLCGRWGAIAAMLGLSAAIGVGLLAGRRGTAADVLGATVVITEIAAWTGLVIGWKS